MLMSTGREPERTYGSKNHMIANSAIFLMIENLSHADKITVLHNNVCSVLFACLFVFSEYGLKGS